MYDDIFNPKYAEWFYGPNTFLLNKIQLNSLRKEGYMMLIKLLFLIKKSRKAEIPENSMITILFIEARR